MWNAGRFKGHYMNIFGYEYWTGIDSDGNTETHLMFKLNCNWNHSYEYMDSDMLRAVNGGFIFFEETHEREVIQPVDYNYECRYDSYSQQKTITPTLGTPILTEYLRCGYIDGSTGQNAFEQAKQFAAVTQITSLAITKLDGTAKGGVVIGISDQLKVPVKYIGLGEGMQDWAKVCRTCSCLINVSL